MKIFSVEEMRSLEKRSFLAGFDEAAVMREAGEACAERIWVWMQNSAASWNLSRPWRMALCVGHGNNGGDALVIARRLRELAPELEMEIFAVAPQTDFRGAAAAQLEFLPPDIPYRDALTVSASDLAHFDVIVDALLGTGFRSARGVSKEFAQVIGAIRASKKPVVSIDLPSGMDGDTGEGGEHAVIADLTITIGYPKTGLLEDAAAENVGMLTVAPLHWDVTAEQEMCKAISNASCVMTPQDAASGFERISHTVYKARRGSVLILGGSIEYPGAPCLSAVAALRSGAGLVRMMTPGRNGFAGNLPHAVIAGSCGDARYWSPDALSEVLPLVAKADCVVIGPGMGRRAETLEFLRGILAVAEQRVILDADALSLVAQDVTILQERARKQGAALTILTPHQGEALRLAEGLKWNRAETERLSRREFAMRLARELGGIVVLKGVRTITASPEGHVWYNCSGCSALATAGSGDVLCGVVAALAASCGAKTPELEHTTQRVAVAVLVHGLAGDRNAMRRGERGVIADDLPEELPAILQGLARGRAEMF